MTMAGPRGLERSICAAGGGAVLLDGAEEALGEEVRVDVDALGVGHGGDSTIEPAAAAPGFPHPMSLGPPGGESGAPIPWSRR